MAVLDHLKVRGKFAVFDFPNTALNQVEPYLVDFFRIFTENVYHDWVYCPNHLQVNFQIFQLYVDPK